LTLISELSDPNRHNFRIKIKNGFTAHEEDACRLAWPGCCS